MNWLRYLTFIFIILLFELQTVWPSESVNNLTFIAPAVAYNPRDFSFEMKFSVSTNLKQIVHDLHLLRSIGFRSIVTYGASKELGLVPDIARQEGFDGLVVMGIWDPSSEEELQNALSQKQFVDGYCIGNEGLGIRYTIQELGQAMNKLRRLTGRPVTTTEIIDRYLGGPYRQWLLENSDWLFPIVLPFWAEQKDPYSAVTWTIARHDYLTTTTDKTIIIKEAGIPTIISEGFSEVDQIDFFKELEKTGISFFYFEAFDQPWKRDIFKLPEPEAHWGLYRTDGNPKKVVSWIQNRWGKK